ncbi:MAG: ATP-binding protein, partial [Flavobacterium sp.]
MQNSLQFRVSSALKDIIGKDLITDDYIAVFELVKNAFDAHATRVDIHFENIYSENPKIIIKDNGKGMNYNDLTNKWLFVAYSAKKEGTEDFDYDYRTKIYSKRAFAGAKGIGRFSCDRLGKYLYLETRKDEPNALTETLITNWERFEEDIRENFIDINILHETTGNSSIYGLIHGTVLEISSLREGWWRDKFLRLKDSLAKLINPSKEGSSQFEIYLHVNEEIENDKGNEYYNVVNGRIKNFIFETLELKTTKIEVSISSDSQTITTELFDGGTRIYKIKEANNDFPLLFDINYTIFYLNHSAKLTFASKMGLPSVQYGHIFVYKNGFRIYPYGEPGEDTLKIDQRKSQGYNRYLGTREILGNIEINSPDIDLKETTSRGDGLIKTETYEQFVSYFWVVLRRLEKYVVEVQRWGMSIESQVNFDFRARVSNLLSKLTDSDDLLEFDIPDNFFEILEASQSSSADNIIQNLNRVALSSDNVEVIRHAQEAALQYEQIKNAKEQAEQLADEQRRRAEEATRKLKDQISENLFLKSINSSDYKEVISLLHHIGIYAGTIDNNLRGISLRLQNNIPLSNEDIMEILKLLSFETKKILNVVTFATKANFKL